MQADLRNALAQQASILKPEKSLNVLFSRKYLFTCAYSRLPTSKIDEKQNRSKQVSDTLPKGMPTRLFTCRLLPFNQASLAPHLTHKQFDGKLMFTSLAWTIEGVGESIKNGVLW